MHEDYAFLARENAQLREELRTINEKMTKHMERKAYIIQRVVRLTIVIVN